MLKLTDRELHYLIALVSPATQDNSAALALLHKLVEALRIVESVTKE